MDDTPQGDVFVLDPDAGAMLAFQRGDESAFDGLYRRWREPLYRFAYRMVGRAGVAEEVAQEAFVRVYRARDRYVATATFRTWLFRIATHLCANERRRAAFRLEVDEQGVPPRVTAPEQGPAREAEGAELGRAVERALLGLPERQRAALVLARYEGCTMAELGAVLEISEGAAKVLLHRAREQLRRELAPWLGAEEAAG